MITETRTASRPVDVYRTRLADHGEIEPRPHPVVWEHDARGPLSVAEVDGYRDRGYHVAENVLSDSDIDTCLTEVEAITDRLGVDERVVRESSSGDVRSLFAVHQLSDAIAEMCDRTEIAGICLLYTSDAADE